MTDPGRGPWLFDRADPRTIFVVVLAINVIGCLVVPRMVAEGGGVRIFGITWACVALSEFVWASWKLRAFLVQRRAG